MADTPNTTTALKTKAALALLAIAGAMMIGRPAAAQTGDATEKQILFTMATLAVAQKKCPSFEVDTVAGGGGWALVASLMRDEKDYIKTWTPSATKLVGVTSNFPTFCDEVLGAYGPEGVPARILPWATPAFRGMLKASGAQ